MIYMLTTSISWEQANNAVLCMNWIAVSVEGSTASESKSKCSLIGASEDVEVVTNITRINNCTSISESILFISEQTADWIVLWQAGNTRKHSFNVHKHASQSTAMKVIKIWTIGN